MVGSRFSVSHRNLWVLCLGAGLRSPRYKIFRVDKQGLKIVGSGFPGMIPGVPVTSNNDCGLLVLLP